MLEHDEKLDYAKLRLAALRATAEKLPIAGGPLDMIIDQLGTPDNVQLSLTSTAAIAMSQGAAILVPTLLLSALRTILPLQCLCRTAGELIALWCM
jgi:hypothetical protein